MSEYYGLFVFVIALVLAFFLAAKTGKFIERFRNKLGNWTVLVSTLVSLAVFLGIVTAGVSGCLHISIAINGL